MFLRVEQQDSSVHSQPSQSYIANTAETQSASKPLRTPTSKSTTAKKMKTIATQRNNQSRPVKPDKQKIPRATFYRTSQHEQLSEAPSEKADLFGQRNNFDMTEVEYCLHLKDKTINELKLQNSLYQRVFENIKIKPSTSHKAIKERVVENSVRKPFKKPHKKVKEEPKIERKHMQVLDYQKIRINTINAEKQQKDQLKFDHLVRNFQESLSRMGRKEVAQKGRESKQLREIWDVWNRLVKQASYL